MKRQARWHSQPLNMPPSHATRPQRQSAHGALSRPRLATGHQFGPRSNSVARGRSVSSREALRVWLRTRRNRLPAFAAGGRPHPRPHDDHRGGAHGPVSPKNKFLLVAVAARVIIFSIAVFTGHRKPADWLNFLRPHIEDPDAAQYGGTGRSSVRVGGWSASSTLQSRESSANRRSAACETQLVGPLGQLLRIRKRGGLPPRMSHRPAL